MTGLGKCLLALEIGISGWRKVKKNHPRRFGNLKMGQNNDTLGVGILAWCLRINARCSLKRGFWAVSNWVSRKAWSGCR